MIKRTGLPDKPFLFFRADGFYYVTLYGDDEDIRANAELNPGTLRIEDLDGNVVWKAPVLQ